MVHGPQNTDHSDFFAAAFKKDWVEGQTREIKLPDEEPELMTHYIDHVYSKKLHVPTDVYAIGRPGFKKEAGFKILAQLYVLAERLLDSKSRNRIVQEIMRLAFLMCPTRSFCDPSPESINIIYKGTMPGSPARRLLVDIHACTTQSPWYPNDVQMDPAFLMDLVRKFRSRASPNNQVQYFIHGDYLV